MSDRPPITEPGGNPPTRRVPSQDDVRWKLDQWEQILPGSNFNRIEAAARIIQCAATLLNDLDRIACHEGLANQQDYQVLSLLRISRHTRRPLTVTDLAAQLGTTTATTVNRIDRLAGRGLVQRKPHPRDRRSVHLSLTPTGTRCVHRIVRARTRQREQWLTALTDNERQTLTALLTKLAIHS